VSLEASGTQRPSSEYNGSNVVIFGGSGDLVRRKLLPALYYLDLDRHLNDATKIISTARSDLSDDQYRDQVKKALDAFVPAHHHDQHTWKRFAKRITYVKADVNHADSFHRIKQILAHDFDVRPSVYYLSTPPSIFGIICRLLRESHLVKENSRIVLEKPVGVDLKSSRQINDAVARVAHEKNVYRIDHYLGKETVQNLLALRFANALFEPVWSSTHIDNVQITVAETVGVEGRWRYYNDSGALRDMVQNHLLQLLSLVAMGVPVSMDPEAVRAEKIKVLKSLKIMSAEEVVLNTVRGQYKEGVVEGESVVGYLEEQGQRSDIAQVSHTETFTAIRADIHNWRWRGVPFFLRTGKRMTSRFSEIVIQFKDVPHSIFPKSANLMPNKLVIRLQPEESIQLYKMNKAPGLNVGMRMLPVTLNLTLPDTVTATRVPEAYERLLFDVMRGDATLFVHRAEVEAAWIWCDAILGGWAGLSLPVHQYPAGSWGPQAAFELIARSGNAWHENN
jgi:glucose-6-phosphate 1-dehydrogenase